ncbi:hypothetical protein [Mucilaginibacter lappiensis]|uniref:Uncharacterized protein n=1 Tax=Mucilaginibacter lappiensis TaxID=354630 RepID=A0A841J9F5_9SPHI|nr:hypothetical protein [Mucilaginibacter lappiensis]MBB6127447.1 hypothetical protein [Mucilaginibacter lappiensis]
MKEAIAMSNNSSFNRLFRILASDQRINVWHFSIYMSLFHKWIQNGQINPISISRSEIMGQTHIGSIVTYHKCIRRLQEYGYIIYEPSYNPFIGSYVSLLVPGKL